MAANPRPEINRSQIIRDYFQQNPKALAKEVVTALAKKGIEVSESHVYVVKGKLKLTRKRKAKEKTATAMVAAAKEKGSAASTPAKPGKKPASPEAPNKSQAIRDLLTQKPKTSVQEVISTLAAQGIDVKKGLVYMVKNSMQSKKRREAKETATVAIKENATTSSDGSGDALKMIKQVRGLAAELGGMKNLKALVEALSE